MEQDDQAAARQPVAANRQFPVPPFYYKAWTDKAWSRFKAVEQHDRAQDTELDDVPNPFSLSQTEQDELIQTPDSLFRSPRVDWVEADGYWETFGQAHPVSLQFRQHLSQFVDR